MEKIDIYEHYVNFRCQKLHAKENGAIWLVETFAQIRLTGCPTSSGQMPKLVQICVYIIKTNLAETLVFRKMQSSFADRLRICCHLCLISWT
jgi:hypothetical protein